MKNFEIERKYLLRPCSPKRFLHKHKLKFKKYTLHQYYLPKKDGDFIRYRRKDNKYFQTIKRGDGLVREEYEKQVPKEEYYEHYNEHIGRVIKKKRFVFEYGGYVYEMDRFGGDLKGLCYLEIEFGNREDAENFILPDIFSELFVAEVTNDKRFDNSSISKSETIPTLDSDLEILVKKIEGRIAPPDSFSDLKFGPYESSMIVVESLLQKLSNELDLNRRKLDIYPEDSEVLHKFRVTCRKITSLLDLFKPMFSKKWQALHKRNISYILDHTNKARDLDVFMNSLDSYKNLLPKKEKSSLESFKKYLSNKKMMKVSEISSIKNSELLLYEIASLCEPGFSKSDQQQPIAISAMKILDSRVDKIIKRGKALKKNHSDKEYHKLRISAKKIRYFIEEMKPIISDKKYHKVLKLLKKIQTVLGNIHDCQIQMLFLKNIHKEIEQVDKELPEVIDKLIAIISIKEQKEKSKFQKKLSIFISKRKRFDKLFIV